MVVVVAQAAGADPDSPPYTIQVDESGANDVPGQKDLTLQGTRYASAGAPSGTVQVLWNWDETSISGGNTLDACTLFDTDTPANGKADAALCLTLGNQPLAKLATTLYSCGDSRVDRCASPINPVSFSSTSCTFDASSSTDPFGGSGVAPKATGASYPNDTRAKCTIYLSEINSTSATLINTCSYPSQQPNSDPSDCVLIPRDAFLKIVKDAGSDTTTSFSFSVTGGTTASPSVQGGLANAVTVPVRSGVATEVTETVPTDWNFSSASCSGGTNNGSPTTNGVTGVTVASDGTATCTVVNTPKAAPQLTISKSCPNSAAASTDRFQAQNNGSNVGAALACGDSVTVTLTPNTGYSISEVAAGTPAANLANYTTTYSTDCSNSSGLARGAATPTCTITNTLRKFTVVTLVCEGGQLYASNVTMDGVTKASSAHGATLPTGVTEASLCSDSTVIDARFTGKVAGSKTATVSITP
jgi:hypothetical protein